MDNKGEEQVELVVDGRHYELLVTKDIARMLSSDQEYAEKYATMIWSYYPTAGTSTPVQDPGLTEGEAILDKSSRDSIPYADDPFMVEVRPGTSTDVPTWTKESTKLLIATRSDTDSQFQTPKFKKKKLWDIVAQKMTATSGAMIVGGACDIKWRNLMAIYKKIKLKNRSTGHETTSWEHFDDIENLMGSKHCVSPPPQDIRSSLEISREEGTVAATTPPPQSMPSTSQATPKRFKRKQSGEGSEAIKWLLEEKKALYEQLERKRQERWEERKEIEIKKISAMNALAEAITNYTQQQQM